MQTSQTGMHLKYIKFLPAGLLLWINSFVTVIFTISFVLGGIPDNSALQFLASVSSVFTVFTIGNLTFAYSSLKYDVYDSTVTNEIVKDYKRLKFLLKCNNYTVRQKLSEISEFIFCYHIIPVQVIYAIIKYREIIIYGLSVDKMPFETSPTLHPITIFSLRVAEHNNEISENMLREYFVKIGNIYYIKDKPSFVCITLAYTPYTLLRAFGVAPIDLYDLLAQMDENLEGDVVSQCESIINDSCIAIQ